MVRDRCAKKVTTAVELRGKLEEVEDSLVHVRTKERGALQQHSQLIIALGQSEQGRMQLHIKTEVILQDLLKRQQTLPGCKRKTTSCPKLWPSVRLTKRTQSRSSPRPTSAACRLPSSLGVQER